MSRSGEIFIFESKDVGSRVLNQRAALYSTFDMEMDHIESRVGVEPILSYGNIEAI